MLETHVNNDIYNKYCLRHTKQHTKVGAEAIILDAGHKLLGVQDILFGFNKKSI